MPTKHRKAECNPATEVDRATEAVRRAIGRLVQLLDAEDDVVLAAAGALDALGARAIVGPLAAALPRASAKRHRAIIVKMLHSYGREEGPAVLVALLAAKKRERDLDVAAVVQGALMDLMLSDSGPLRPDPPTTGRTDD
jgi:hypothetical protein